MENGYGQANQPKPEVLLSEKFRLFSPFKVNVKTGAGMFQHPAYRKGFEWKSDSMFILRYPNTFKDLG